MTKGLVTVIIPAFNGERYIAATVSSILRQDYPALELLVVDDASVDRTPAIISEFKDNRIRFYRNPRRRGIAGTKNAALRKARGEYVQFFDHDDLMLPKALGKRVTFLKEHPQVQSVFGYTKAIIDSRGRIARKHPFELEYRLQKEGIAFCRKVKMLDLQVLTRYKTHFRFAFLSNFLIRRNVIKKVGLFNESLQIADDTDYLFRLCKKSPPYFLNVCVKLYRVHKNNASLQLTRLELWRESLKLRGQANPWLTLNHCSL